MELLALIGAVLLGPMLTVYALAQPGPVRLRPLVGIVPLVTTAALCGWFVALLWSVD